MITGWMSLYGHYLHLALVAFRRAPVVTSLIIVAVAVGISASMTVYTVFRSMAGDPLPHRSQQLFVPQIENRAPSDRDVLDEPPSQLTFSDAMALGKLAPGYQQVTTYPVGIIVTPSQPGLRAFRVEGRATTADFFAMFDARFQYGHSWARIDDDTRSNVVVLSSNLNDKLFGGADSTGRVVRLYDHDYRVVGVLRLWNPVPRFYDVINGPFNKTEDIFLPLTVATERAVPGTGRVDCYKPRETNRADSLISECTSVQYWVRLPTMADRDRYLLLLQSYALEQQRNGRFDWVATTRLRNMRQWLAYQRVASDEFRLSVILGDSFFAVCLINAVGLILTKYGSRTGEFGVRRALGASRADLLGQCLVESAAIGLAGGVLGLAFTGIGLALERSILPPEMSGLAQLDGASILLTLAVAILATVVTGLYPALWASQVQPGTELKTQ